MIRAITNAAKLAILTSLALIAWLPIVLLLVAAITKPEWVQYQFWLGGTQW
jgi:hypothetical protein